MDDPLSLLIAGVSVSGAAAPGAGDGRGLIARPGAMVVVGPSLGRDLEGIRAREADSPEALLASGVADGVVRSGEVGAVRYDQPRKREKLTIGTATGEIVVERPRAKDGVDFLRRAAQRAFGFGMVPPTQPGAGAMLGIRHPAVTDVPCGLVARSDGLWLFAVPAPTSRDRGRIRLKNTGEVVVGVVADVLNPVPEGASSPLQGSVGAYGWEKVGERHTREHVDALRKGSVRPTPPPGAGCGAGHITDVLLDERHEGDIRIAATIDGREVELSCARDPETRGRLRHLVACTLGERATAVR